MPNTSKEKEYFLNSPKLKQNDETEPVQMSGFRELVSHCNKLNITCKSNEDCSKDSSQKCSICWTDDANEDKKKICGPSLSRDNVENKGKVRALTINYL